jgi:hypothetical protein
LGSFQGGLIWVLRKAMGSGKLFAIPGKGKVEKYTTKISHGSGAFRGKTQGEKS